MATAEQTFMCNLCREEGLQGTDNELLAWFPNIDPIIANNGALVASGMAGNATAKYNLKVLIPCIIIE